MGMAASQVRFLSLQSRKNTIGLNLMTLSNRKLALSRDMNRVAAEYNEAMNQKVLKWSGDSGVTYQGLNYNLLMKPNENNATLPYIVTDAQGRVVVDDTNIELDGQDTGVSYRDLAMMISAYSGYSEDDTKTHYMNYANNTTAGYTDNLTGADTTGVTEDAIRNIGDKGTGGVADADKATAGTANENGYEIVSTANQLASNSLRYDLMEKLGLIDKTEIQQIEDLEIELYGPSKNPNADKFPIGTLMGDYYLACANLEAYKNFLEDGTYEFAAGSDPKTGQSSTNGTYTKTTNAADGSGKIEYEDQYKQGGSDIYFNGQSSYIEKVDLTQKYTEGNDPPISAITTENGTIFTDTNSTFSYTINNGEIKYDFSTSNLLSMMGNVNYSTGAYQNNRDHRTDDVKDMSWQELITGNYAIDLHWEINDMNCERGDYESKVRDFIGAMADGIAVAGTYLSIDQTALDKAEQSTEAFFLGDITNGGDCKDQEKTHADNSEKQTINEAISTANEYNLVGEGTKRFCFYPWKINRASHATTINAQNVYNTMITFYQYYYHNPEANAIVDSTGGTFTTGTDSSASAGAEGIDTSGMTYDESKNVWFESGGQWYIRKTMESSKDVTNDDGSIETISSTFYHYYRVSGNGSTTLLGDALQEDIISSSTPGVVNRTVKNADGSYSSYEMQSSAYDVNNASTGGKYVGSNGWTPTSSSGASGTISGDVLILKYKDENGNDVEFKLANKVSDSKYATTISSVPLDAEDKLKELKAAVDEAAKAKDDALSQLDKLFAEKESKIMDYFDSIFKMIAENGWVYDENVNSDNKEQSQEYLNAMLQNNMYFITEVDTLDGTDFNYATKLATNVSKIFEVYDEDAQNQALSKYEAEKAEINSKEKQVDIRMNKLETEQDAIKTELDSLKKIIDDNVQATFKIFT